MNLRSEFETAWTAGNDADFLLAVVRRYQQQGLQGLEAYRILEKLWLDCGFNDSDVDSDRRNNLEYVLETLWYWGDEVYRDYQKS